MVDLKTKMKLLLGGIACALVIDITTMFGFIVISSLKGTAYYSAESLIFSAEIWIAGLVVSMIMFFVFSALLFRTYRAYQAEQAARSGPVAAEPRLPLDG